MKYLVIFVFILFSSNIFAQRTRKKNIHWMRCKMQRGTKSQVKIFSLHRNYDLFVPFNSLYAYILADHMGNAGNKGRGYRFTIFVRDSKIGGMVQGQSSPVLKGPWWRHNIVVEDNKHKTKISCQMK